MLRRSLLTAVAAAPALCQQSGNQRPLLDGMRAEHPRLLLTKDRFEETRKSLAEDEQAASLFEKLRQHGMALLQQEPVRYEIIGPRLLTQSRNCVERMYVFAALAHLDPPSVRWVEGALANLRAAAAFKDWNPSHFLDVAEMTHAFAIAYDWLFDLLSESDRAMIREAIVSKGLRPAIDGFYRGGKDGAMTGWAVRENNWNQVCNGGMILGALAIAETESTLAEEVLGYALKSLPVAMREFAPDGGWFEGVGYWAYTLRYTVPLIAALDSALGKRFGLDEFEGFAQTGDFYLHAAGPTGLVFNFSDCSRQSVRGFPWLHWLARRFDRPAWHWAAKQGDAGKHPLSLLWREASIRTPAQLGTPREAVFVGMNAAMMRSSWEDPLASFAGFYAGHNGVAHSQLEMGTFVFDALGERWVEELGTDDYDLPGYFGARRWDYYRLNSQGQNVMLFDGMNQLAKAQGRITSSGAENGSAHAIADLSEGYVGQATRVRRGVRLTNERRVLLVQDEFELKAPAVYEWQIHTMAQVKTTVDHAQLILGDKTVEVRVLSRLPVDYVQVQARPAVLQRGDGKTENTNDKYTRLVIRTRDKVRRGTVGVMLQPLRNPNVPRGAGFIKPLDAWD
ncbi:MAG: heparinase II/III family protein [Bryobacterales bacterium]|nr:heparinase II/III family protein [Bryobacterales bacterium]